jgi:integrase/recombinase XerD
MPSKVNLKHYLLIRKGKENDCPIYLRITFERKKAEIHSGYSCSVKDWDEKNQIVKSNVSITKQLASQKTKVYELIIDLQKENRIVSATILKELYSGKTKKETFLLEYFAKYISELKTRNEIKLISLNKYNQSLNTLKKFIASDFKNQDIQIEQINYSFINGYDLYLKQEYDLHKNTINKYHSRLRTILIRAFSEGLIIKQPYSNFKLATIKSDREFLSQEDLNKIIALALSHNKSLDKVKDIFIFSCYTGLRFQDAQNLTTHNLTAYKNKSFLRFAQEKTGRAVDIPLLPIAKKIIDKYKHEPERKILNKLLPKISNQKVNSYLKIISDQSEINRKLTHHMARHTFATTICLNNGMALEDVSKMLGHSSLKTTQIYGRITQARLNASMNKISKKI